MNPLNKTAILTDSACDLPIQDTKRLNIHVMCIDLVVDGKGYVERVDFTPEEFLSILENCNEMPTTSQITTLRMVEQYKELAAAGYTAIVHTTISSTGSGIYNNALASKKMYEEEYGADAPLEIHVVDSKSYSVGYGFPLVTAAEMAQDGRPAAEIAKFLRADLENTQILLGMYSLKFAKKSGRISTVAAFAGEMMGLKPVVLMQHGETTTVGRARGDAALLPALVKEAEKRMPKGAPYVLGYTKPGNLAPALELFTETFGYGPEMCIPLGVAVTCNAGPDSFGVRFST